MALDIRLDYIKNIDQVQIECITKIRKLYMSLDDELKIISDQLANKPAGARAAALARTNLEIACQFSIKSLCLLGEIE